MELSIVTTIYNDETIVPLLVSKIKEAVVPLNVEYEIILVNDNSPDNSEEAIKLQCANFKEVKGISLSRNYGQQIAMSAGMRHATGNYVVIKEGYDLVYTTGTQRNSWRDELSSKFFWWVLSKLFNVKVVPYQLMMKIMSKGFLRRFNSYNEQSRTIAGIVNDIGLKYTILPVENKKRLNGKSNYNFLKRFNLMIDVIISFSNAPLNIMIHFGWIIFSLTSLAAFYQLYLYINDSIPEGYTSTILSIFFFGSLNILMLGFIGRYLANIYAEVKNRPLFDVQKTYNL
jgi:dolichol-phosphate mannosyltransferase